MQSKQASISLSALALIATSLAILIAGQLVQADNEDGYPSARAHSQGSYLPTGAAEARAGESYGRAAHSAQLPEGPNGAVKPSKTQRLTDVIHGTKDRIMSNRKVQDAVQKVKPTIQNLSVKTADAMSRGAKKIAERASSFRDRHAHGSPVQTPASGLPHGAPRPVRPANLAQHVPVPGPSYR